MPCLCRNCSAHRISAAQNLGRLQCTKIKHAFIFSFSLSELLLWMYLALGNLNLWDICMWYMRSPPFRYSITKNRWLWEEKEKRTHNLAALTCPLSTLHRVYFDFKQTMPRLIQTLSPALWSRHNSQYHIEPQAKEQSLLFSAYACV